MGNKDRATGKIKQALGDRTGEKARTRHGKADNNAGDIGEQPARWLSRSRRRDTRFAVSHHRGPVFLALTALSVLAVTNIVNAAIVPTVPLATAANYAVLGGTTVTNTGPSTLDGSVGVAPGTSIIGFPPGQVLPPGTTDAANAVAQQAQSDLTAAYVDAAGRALNATTTADLSDLTLVGGVYAGPTKGPLSLTGTLILDGQNDPNSVFIFQTDSTLTTGSSSTVTLINGAQECNVFWQVGSSATLGTGSVFAGNILALTSITVTTGVTVHGRALARNGDVILDNDTFTRPTCAGLGETTTTTTTAAPTTTEAPATTTPEAVATTVSRRLPVTGSQNGPIAVLGVVLLTLGAATILLARRKTLPPQ